MKSSNYGLEVYLMMSQGAGLCLRHGLEQEEESRNGFSASVLELEV